MATRWTPLGRVTRPSPGFAYLIDRRRARWLVLSGVVGGTFTSNMVTGAQHERIPVAALTGWILNVIAMAMVVSVAIQGIRADVAERASWTMLGLGVGAIWLGVMFVAIFAPVWVTGTDPPELPMGGTRRDRVMTAILSHLVRVTGLQPAGSGARPGTTAPTVGSDLTNEDPAVKLRQLAQLRDSGAITEAASHAKKDELLSRI